MGSRYASPQQTQNISEEQNSRRHRPGVVGASEGTVASRIKVFNEREARSGQRLPSKEVKARVFYDQRPLLPVLSPETTLQRRADSSSDACNPEGSRNGTVYKRSSQSGEGEGEKVSDYPNEYEDFSKASWDSTIETRSLRRVASQHSVRYPKAVPTTPTTERDKNGAYVLVGAKARSNVESTSPYAVKNHRALLVEPYGQSGKKPKDRRQDSRPATQDQAQGRASAGTVFVKGAYNADARQRFRSFIPVYRKGCISQLRDVSAGYVDEVDEVGEEIERITAMIDIMAAEHFHYIQRIATQLSEGRCPSTQIAMSTATPHDLATLILLIEFHADTWVDCQTRRSIEDSTATIQLPPPSAATPLPLTARQTGLESIDNPPQPSSNPTLQSSMDSEQGNAPAQAGHMPTATTRKRVTFDGKPLITPLRLN